jgi:hypothetical protein
MIDYQTLVTATAGARRLELAELDRVAPMLPRRSRIGRRRARRASPR